MGWVSLCCCLLVGVCGRMGVVLLLSFGGCFWWDGYRFAVVFWWVFAVGWVSFCFCLSVGVSGRMGIALLLSFGGCFW